MSLGHQVRQHPCTVRAREGIPEVQVVERLSEPSVYARVGEHARARLATMHTHVNRNAAQHVMEDPAADRLHGSLGCVDRTKAFALGPTLEPPRHVVGVQGLAHLPNHRRGDSAFIIVLHDHCGLANHLAEHLLDVRRQREKTFGNRHFSSNDS